MVVSIPDMRKRLATLAILALTGMAALTAPSSAAAAGPEVGSKIPEFAAVDQFGNTRNFETLRGENGLLLLFFRSADW